MQRWSIHQVDGSFSASVCTVIMTISLAVERILHNTGKANILICFL
uniref:Uncharacterized protein n=1 Tax=Nelumbo nucifera TaxID=4432 RepID=A0A822YMQ9_NELNU|nr:TPA_asm: hypothetical protein HUJ06_011430 [Nelumbo nucifera]